MLSSALAQHTQISATTGAIQRGSSKNKRDEINTEMVTKRGNKAAVSQSVIFRILTAAAEPEILAESKNPPGPPQIHAVRHCREGTWDAHY